MEPLEKAVAKALQAKRGAPGDIAVEPAQIDKTAPLIPPKTPAAPERQLIAIKLSSELPKKSELPKRQAHGVFEQPTKPTSPVEPTEDAQSLPHVNLERQEDVRRLNARKQLFPGANPAQGKPPLRAPELKPESADIADAISPPPSNSPSQAAPNGSLAMLDPKKLDELVSQRLAHAPQPRTSNAESTPDSLNVLKLLDRELGLWETAIRTTNLPAIKASRPRSLELQSQVPPSIAQPLDATIAMLCRQSDSMDAPSSAGRN